MFGVSTVLSQTNVLFTFKVSSLVTKALSVFLRKVRFIPSRRGGWFLDDTPGGGSAGPHAHVLPATRWCSRRSRGPPPVSSLHRGVGSGQFAGRPQGCVARGTSAWLSPGSSVLCVRRGQVTHTREVQGSPVLRASLATGPVADRGLSCLPSRNATPLECG